MAAVCRNPGALVILIEAKANMDKLIDSGATPLFIASQKTHVLIVEVFITGKASLEKVNASCENLL